MPTTGIVNPLAPSAPVPSEPLGTIAPSVGSLGVASILCTQGDQAYPRNDCESAR